MKSKHERVPEWVLERMHLGELGAEEAVAWQARLAAEPGGAERLLALEGSDREILEHYRPSSMAARIESRHAESGGRRRWQRPLLWSAPLAAGALAVLLLWTSPAPRGDDGEVPAPLEMVRLKGDAQLLVHRLHLDAIEQLPLVGAEAGAGDLLQISYRSPAQRFGVILSVDGRGVVTRHFPEGGYAAQLETGGIVTLLHAYELDDAPAVERFFLVVGPDRFALDTVEAAARRLGQSPEGLLGARRVLMLPEALTQTSVIVRKVTP